MKQQAIRQVAQVTTTPAPVKGLNAYDSIVAMPPGFAIVLRNFFAQPYGCQVRKGYRKHVTEGILGNVESLASHNGLTGSKLYAWALDNTTGTMYDVSTPNAPAVQKLTGLKNARWQHCNLANAAGVHMVCVNGEDNMIWVQPNDAIIQVTSGDGSVNTISGVDPKTFIDVYSHQKRLWFVEKNSSRGWYLPPEQITGVAKSFNFGTNWTRGGYLSQIITWTIDDGNGADDHLAAISSEGQVSIYTGTDVEAVDNWSLQGVYYAGAPAGRRAAVRYGGDIMMITEFGQVMMSDLLKSTKVNPAEQNFSKYVQQLISQAVSLSRDEFGWQPFIFPAENMVIINIPATKTTSYQLVMNDITKAWSEFIGYNAYCWELHEQLPFFGSFGGVYRAWEGTSDDGLLVNLIGGFDASSGALPNDPLHTPYIKGDQYKISGSGTLNLYNYSTKVATNIAVEAGGTITYYTSGTDPIGWYDGAPPADDIRAEAQTTFDYFGSLGQQKHFKMVRPTLLSRGDFSLNFSVNTDFVFNSPTAPASFTFTKPGVWNEDLWNSVTWGGGLSTYKSWQAVTGIGTAAGIRLLVRSQSETYWASTDWAYEMGGIL